MFISLSCVEYHLQVFQESVQQLTMVLPNNTQNQFWDNTIGLNPQQRNALQGLGLVFVKDLFDWGEDEFKHLPSSLRTQAITLSPI